MSRRKKSIQTRRPKLTVENLEDRRLKTADLMGDSLTMECYAYDYDVAYSTELIAEDYQVDFAESELRLSGQIVDGGQADVYQLSAQAGTTYTLETILGSLPDSTLKVFDASGRQVAFNDDFGGSLASRVEFTASVDGPYYVQVAAYSIYQTGTYELEVTMRDDSQLGGGAVSATPIQLPIFSTQEQVSTVDDYFARVASLPIPIPYSV